MSLIKKSEDLNSELERIKIEREQVRDRLNEIRPRKRMHEGNERYRGYEEERESKRRVIPSSVSVSGDNQSRSEIVITDKDREERKAAMQTRSSNMSDNMQNRNRRMFGGLLGHLSKARTILTKDQSLFERQRKLENDVVEREKKESETIRSVQIQVKREQAEKERNRLNELQVEERILRLKKTLQNRCNGYTTLGKYCLTNTQPAIYWLPANGNTKSDEYLDRSKKAMEVKCEEERKRIESEIESVHEQMRLREEERKREAEKRSEEKEAMKVEEPVKVDSKMLDLDSESEEEEKKEMEEKTEKKEEKMEEEKSEKKEEKMEEEKSEKKEEKMEEEKKEEKMEKEMEVEGTTSS